jgi:dipeptidase E
MRLLLTSAGIKNTSISYALVDLLGKSIAESSALCIPTAAYANHGGAGNAWRFISGREARTPMCELGWKSLGVLELTALPSIDEERWVPMVKETDVLLVGGGDPLYLCHWMRQSGLADLLPSLRDAVYVGLSAGSMVMAPRIGEDFVRWKPPTGGDSSHRRRPGSRSVPPGHPPCPADGGDHIVPRSLGRSLQGHLTPGVVGALLAWAFWHGPR